MNFLIGFAVSHARASLLLFLVILTAGTTAYVSMPKEAAPDVAIPYIHVAVSYPGISPDDGERLLGRVLERELSPIPGVVKVDSSSGIGSSGVLLEFEAGFDPDAAYQDVSKAVDEIRSLLPEGSNDPVVTEINVALFPVLAIAIYGNLEEMELIRLARPLRDELETLPGVLGAEISGERDRIMQVILDQTKLSGYGISYADVTGTVARNNRIVSAGSIENTIGKFPVNVRSLLESSDDARTLPVKTGDDSVLTLGEIATVSDVLDTPDTLARMNGARAIIIELKKRIGANIIETTREAREIAAKHQASWPAGVHVLPFQNDARRVEEWLGNLENGFIAAFLLVMIIVIAALGPRTGLLVGLCIPASFLAGILLLSLADITINMVVLFGLILSIGLLADNSIVVSENAARRMEAGVPPARAWTDAARRMLWPVTMGTATTLAAFSPLLFWPGMTGKFIIFLPMTVTATMAGSLAIALLFLPALGGWAGRPWGSRRRGNGAGLAGDEYRPDELSAAGRLYFRLCLALVRRPWRSLCVIAGVFGLILFAFVRHSPGTTLFPVVEPEQMQIYIRARGEFSIYEQERLVRQVEARLLEIPDFSSVYLVVGKEKSSRKTASDLIGAIAVEFRDWRRRRPSDLVIRDVRQAARDIPGIIVEPYVMAAGPSRGKPVQVRLASTDRDLLEREARRLSRRMGSFPGLMDIEDNLPPPGVEWQIDIDRAEAGRFGASTDSLGAILRLATGGLKLGEYTPDDSDEEIDIVARFPLRDRTPGNLDSLMLMTPRGEVPVSAFVTVSPAPPTGTIIRTDGLYSARIDASLAPGAIVSVVDGRLREWLSGEAGVDPRVQVLLEGQGQDSREAANFLVKAFLSALVLVVLLLVLQFNSFLQAFQVLTAIMLSLAGIMLGIMVTGGVPSVIMTGISAVAVSGIVVNNNIILIDSFNRLRAQPGSSAGERIASACALRLRPVFLTVFSTILGLLPTALELGVDFPGREIIRGGPTAQWWSELARHLSFGIGFATLVTLVAQPCMLAAGARLAALRSRPRQVPETGDTGTGDPGAGGSFS